MDALNTKAEIEYTFFKMADTIPYDDISVIKLCKESHIGRTTFYRYFSSIDELVFCCENRIIDGLIEIVRDSIAYDNEPLLSKHRRIFLLQLDYILLNRHYILPMLTRYFGLRFRSKLRNIMIEHVSSNLQLTSVSTYHSHYIVNGTVAALAQWLDDLKATKEEFLDFILDTFSKVNC